MRYVYIDEAGNKDINVPKDGATDFYVVAAAIVNESDRSDFATKVETIAKQHFSGSQLKSSNVGSNEDRRARVLMDLSDLPAHFYAVVIDKRRLQKERGGLRYGRVFYKYILRIAQKELLASFTELDLTIDDHGSEEFKQSFLAYMDRYYNHDLFSKNRRRFSKAEESRGVQVADFVAGSLMKAVEAHDRTGAYPAFFASLDPNLTFQGPWPRGRFPYHLERAHEDPDLRFHEGLIEMSAQRAETYLTEHDRSSDPDSRARVVTLQRLLSTFRGTAPRNYVPGPVLRKHIQEHLPGYAIKGQAFMNKVIAPLRDDGLPVVASDKGYKLPVCMAEVLAHMDNTCGKVRPMVSRLGKFRDAVKLATDGSIDLFGREEYAFLRLVEDHVPAPARSG